MINKTYYDDAIKIRRDLHKIPEVGFREFKTQKYIMDFLTELNLPYQITANTGLACYLNMHQGTTIALRSDMDGLPITEENNVDYKSLHEGFMHACGHDGHITMLLLYAKYIIEEKITLPNNVLLLFQPAEEGPGGAKKIIEEGVLAKYEVKHIFGLHLSPDHPFGTIASKAGEFFASGIEFFIRVTGKR